MSDDFDNDPFDEAPVHQLDSDGDVAFDEGVGPGEKPLRASRSENESEGSSRDERDAD